MSGCTPGLSRKRSGRNAASSLHCAIAAEKRSGCPSDFFRQYVRTAYPFPIKPYPYSLPRSETYADLNIYILTVSIWKEMLSLLPPESAALPPSEKPSLLLKQILLFIHHHYSESVSLDDISSHVHLSRSECCRCFHRLTGQPLFQ